MQEKDGRMRILSKVDSRRKRTKIATISSQFRFLKILQGDPKTQDMQMCTYFKETLYKVSIAFIRLLRD